jgi:hypothetical protein
VPLLVGDRLAVLAGIALVVAAQAMGQTLEQHRPFARPHRGQKAAERLPDRAGVVSVDGLAVHHVGGDDVADPLDLGVGRAWGELSEAVVLADEDQRQLPERRQVDRLVEITGLHRAVAEEDDGDDVAAADPIGKGGAERQRDVAADHAGGPHQPMLGVDDVHRAAEPVAEPLVAAHQLGQQTIEGGALGDRVSVRAVPAVDGIVGSQLATDGSRHTLLSDAEMDQAVDLVSALKLPDPLFEEADPPHRGEQARGGLGVEPVAGH